MFESGASDQGASSQQQGLARLHRRLQRLQDERIHLEGVLAHERSLLAQQRSDNAQLRSQLAAHSSQQADNAAMHFVQAEDASLHMKVASHHHRDDVHAPEGQQHCSSSARDHFLNGLHNEKCQHDTHSNGVAASGQQLANQLLQLQAELALIDSERRTLSVELEAQQAQHDSELAALHAASAEHEDSLHVRQQLIVDSSWHARAVQLQAQHAGVVSELHAAQEQCKRCFKQVQMHGSTLILDVTVLLHWHTKE